MRKQISVPGILSFPLAIALIGCFVAYSANVRLLKAPAKSSMFFFRDTIKVINANTLSLQKENDSTNLTVLEGDVILQQGKTIFKADKAIKNDRLNTFEAWGHVHINDADTTHIYSDHLKYFGTPQIANLDGNVRLTDGKATLTTPSMVYNMNTNMGTYKEGGKVVNKKTVITSKEGEYYSDWKDVYFKKNVVVTDPAYHITTDSLKYNTNTQIATFITQTHIKDSARRSIDTPDGFYNLRTGVAEFNQRSSVYDADRKTTVTGDALSLTDSIAKATGNAIVTDSIRGTIIIANLIFQNRLSEAVLATQKPVMIIKQDSDSIYVAADTLFSARLTDLFEMRSSHIIDTSSLISLTDSAIAGAVQKDTLKKKDTGLVKNKKPQPDQQDSTDRYFEAFHNVRIYSDSMQAISDSLFYSFKDSTFRLYKDPVVWGKESQITGDTVLVHTQNKQPSWMEAYNNGFMVNYVAEEAYNQIKSSRIDAYFLEGGLDSIRAKGSAEFIYYLQDDDSAFTGVNQGTCDIIDSYFKDKQLNKIVLRSNVDGTIYPIKQKSPGEMKLEGFKWREALRPKTKYDLFE
ncbi:MAG: OstA-like protein [Niabella sp.]